MSSPPPVPTKGKRRPPSSSPTPPKILSSPSIFSFGSPGRGSPFGSPGRGSPFRSPGRGSPGFNYGSPFESPLKKMKNSPSDLTNQKDARKKCMTNESGGSNSREKLNEAINLTLNFFDRY